MFTRMLLATVLAVSLSPFPAIAEDVCYMWFSSNNLTEALQLDVKQHSSLSSSETAFSVHGKYSVSDKRPAAQIPTVMATVSGTVVKGTTTVGGQKGVHMGLNVQVVREFTRGQPPVITRYLPITLDCTAEGQSAIPATWRCSAFGRDTATDIITLNSTLKKDPTDKACAFFED